jgi:hypothetical protein
MALRALAGDQRCAAAMSRHRSRIVLVAIAFIALASIFFGLRSYSSCLLLCSAYEAGQPQVSSLRAWMSRSVLKPVASPQSAAISVPNSNHAYLRS